MKVKVNKDRCISCGSCVASIDDVFTFEDDGKAGVVNGELVSEYSVGEIDNNMDEVIEFADNKYCPGDAISYEK